MSNLASQPDFVTRLGLTEPLWIVIRRTAAEFEQTGDWVTFDTLAYEAAEQDRTWDLTDIYRIPNVLGGAWSEEKVSLTSLGLLVSGAAPRTCERLARLARICGERKLAFKDDAKIGKTILVSDYGLNDSEAIAAQHLLGMIPGVSGGGQLGDDWSLTIHRSALTYRHVKTADDLRDLLERQAQERLSAHQQALAAAPAFLPGGLFGGASAVTDDLAPSDDSESVDDTSVFVVSGRDREAKDALWDFLRAIGLHPLDWEEDLVALTGQGTPFIGQVLDAAFKRARAVVVLLTPDDMVTLHSDLVEAGEEPFETEMTCQARPNVIFEAGMAFGFNPTRTILVEIGQHRPVSDLGGRHTIRLGTADTLRGLARRLEAAGCAVDRESDASWCDPTRFTNLQARRRRP